MQDSTQSAYGVHGSESSARDVPGYSREEGFSRRGEYGASSQYEQERNAYGGHGGRSGNARGEYYDDRPSAQEYRPAQSSGGMVYNGNYYDAAKYAEKYAGLGDVSLFNTATGYLSGREKEFEHDSMDEREFTGNHRAFYEDNGGRGENSPRSFGQAAAMQALKRFTKDSDGRSGVDQNAFIGMAMAEAVKLFDSQSNRGNVEAGSSKQEVVNSAAQMALKLFLKSQADSGSGGSGSGLMGMASKFL
jgi:hypothetical protein